MPNPTAKKRTLFLIIGAVFVVSFGLFFGLEAIYAQGSQGCPLPSGQFDQDGDLVDMEGCGNGGDMDDQNEFVNPAATEGLCGPGGCVSGAEIWEVGGKEYANCRDYYDAGQPSQTKLEDSGCILKNDTLTPYYVCETYLSSKLIDETSAKPIDNNQNGLANEKELSCPKPGGLVPCGRYADDPITPEDESQPCGFCHFFSLFDGIVSWLITRIVPALALLLLVVGGFVVATSRGNASQLSKGRDIIIWTLAGYAVILVGWMVLNSFFSGMGVKTWTGLGGETIKIQKVHGNLIWTPREDLDTESLDGVVLEITKSNNQALVGEKRIIKRIWDENEINTASPNADCSDSADLDDETGSPTAQNTHDCIETTEGWPSGVPQEGDELRIGGWWQFSCKTE